MLTEFLESRGRPEDMAKMQDGIFTNMMVLLEELRELSGETHGEIRCNIPVADLETGEMIGNWIYTMNGDRSHDWVELKIEAPDAVLPSSTGLNGFVNAKRIAPVVAVHEVRYSLGISPKDSDIQYRCTTEGGAERVEINPQNYSYGFWADLADLEKNFMEMVAAPMKGYF